METLYENQREISDAISKFIINIKKTAGERRKSEYFKRRLELLENYWLEYEGNHKNICEFGTEDHTYFMNSDYENTRKLYQSAKDVISQQQQELGLIAPLLPKSGGDQAGESFEKPPQKGQISGPKAGTSRDYISSGTSSKTEDLLRKQSVNFRAFMRTARNIRLDSISEKWEFEDVLKELQSRWSAIDSLHWDIYMELNGDDSEYEELFTQHETTFINLKRSINKKLWSAANRDKAIPQIDIPVFSGSYQQWTSFKDLFNESVHNNPSLSLAQKMQFLKGKLRGEAERLIQHLPISSANYNVCWEILNNRYNNKKLFFTSHLNTLLGLSNMAQQSLTQIKRMHDVTLECLHAIENLGVDITSWDPLLVHLLSQKMDTETYNDYMESVKQPRELPTLKEFLDFLETKFTTLETSRRKQENNLPKSSTHTPINQASSYKYQSNNSFRKPNYYKNAYSSSTRVVSYNKNKCSVCYGYDHGIFNCQKFLAMPPFLKKKTVTKLNVCPNCLHNHHGQPCFSDKRCRNCNKPHNTILHEAFDAKCNSTPESTRPVAGSAAGTSKREQPQEVQSNTHVSLQNDVPEVLLATAIIKVQAADGTNHNMRALLDQGSQTSLITENAAQMLGLPRQRCKGVISGIGTKESNCKGMLSIKCFSLVSDYSFDTDVLIMKSLIKNLPTSTFFKPNWPYLEQIKLADPEFYVSRPVDILLGADVYSNILMDGICRENSTLPTAQQTRLGWILSGNVKTFQCNVVLNNLDEIQRFWEVEDVTDLSELSSEDQYCINFYQNTTTRRSDGKYVVRLPIKQECVEKLGESKSKTLAQFYQLEKKISKQTEVLDGYMSFVNEYIELGHMIPASGNSKPHCYLPHHCVYRDDSTTTKLRVVFNASSKTSTGVSLNDAMHRGPNLQQDLQSLIIKWRQYQFAYTADLEKMFRQIWVHPADQHLQKIIWRPNQSRPVQEYQLATVTYGTKAAPFLAMMTLKQLAHDERPNYEQSRASEVLESSFYMDDLVHGSHTAEQAKKLQIDLINLLKTAGFNLRKWKSNLPLLLEGVSTDIKDQEFDFKQAELSKTLGLRWKPREDQFTFQSQLPLSSGSPTKRSLLSDISKLFDPLGWLSPLTIKLKILFQDVWKENLDWDDKLPTNISSTWDRIKTDLKNIDRYQIPRWLNTCANDHIELHGFCDASIRAYAAVVYIKVKKPNSDSSVVLIAAKARLVPVSKTISLPRLELCGALLLAKLMEKIIICLSSYTIKIYGWVDSMVVLAWLNGDTNRWKPYVANRVKQITENIPATAWHYIKSEENPADCASRGLTATQLKEHVLWRQGPYWLRTHTESDKTENFNYITNEEVRKKHVAVTQVSVNENIINQLLNRCSSLSKAVRVLAWVLRLARKQEKPSYLTLSELNKANIIIIKQVQKEFFFEEISKLKENKIVSNKSNILCLSPKLDENGVLRVGGRLKHANIDIQMKHPIIIPSNTRLADLIIDQCHLLTYHGGARLTVAYLRQKYWIPSGIRATEKRLRQCVTCKRHDPDKQHQLMADLPSSRTNPSRPFYHTGVDYTGHIFIKANKGRGIKTTKGYVAVFVCMATKAVHLDLVSDLTTSAFLAALRRMAARRGVPRHIYSDQGTNFVGANKILQQELITLKNIINQEFMTEIVQMGIDWHHNAPSWPSAGGLWEAAVKSLKYHLKRVIGEQRLTYEEYSTILAQLEACLNSRPLCPLTEDPDDIDCLTPSHFLSSGPALTLYETERDLRTRWQLTQKLYNDIWRRWRCEYLTQLSTRGKWKQPQPYIKIDDVVVIQDANLPPGKWALGRVMQLHTGEDGFVRVVTLKTKNGYIKRPIVKLSTNDLHQNNDIQKGNLNSTPSLPSNKRQIKPNSNKKYSFVSMSMALLLFFVTLISSSHAAYHNIKPLTNNSLYFESITNMHVIRDNWRLVVYYDLYPYQQGNTALYTYIKYLQNICMQIRRQSNCDGIMLQLRHEFSELKHNNDILIHQQGGERTRRRRGLINGVGYLANSLFGVLDQSFADKYEKDINILKENQNHLALLYKNQTSIVEAEFNLVKRTENIMDRHHKIINQKLTSIENSLKTFKDELQNISMFNEFFVSAMIANNLLFSLKNMQATLLDSLTNLHNGKLSFHLLTSDQLRHELNIIAGQLPKDLSSPIANLNLPSIYNLLEIKARMLTDYLLFEIKIPLIGRDTYEIFQLIPIPRPSGLQMIKLIPISSYVAVNLQKDLLITMTEEEIKSCVSQATRFILCHINKPTYLIKDDQSMCETELKSRTCKTVITPCQNIWMALNHINKYFFYCCNQCQLKLLCGDHVTAVQLTGSGLFTIVEGCMMKSADFFMYTQNQHMFSNQINVSSKLEIPVIPSINHIINITIPSLSDLNMNSSDANNHIKVINELQDKLEVMKQNEPFINQVSYHDVHHYFAIYIIVVIMGVVVIIYVWRRVRCVRRGASATNVDSSSATATQVPVELAVSSVSSETDQGVNSDKCKLSVKQRCRGVYGVSESVCESAKLEYSARSRKQDRSTSPVLRSVFSVIENDKSSC